MPTMFTYSINEFLSINYNSRPSHNPYLVKCFLYFDLILIRDKMLPIRF